MIAAVIDFADRLRRAGVDVPVSATVDATEALRHINLGRREDLRVALAATMVKRASDLEVFALIFERCFPPAVPVGVGGSSAAPPAGQAAGQAAEADPPDLAGAVAAALAAGDGQALDALARRAVERYAGLEATHSTARYHRQRVERALNLSGAAQAAVRATRPDGQRRGELDERVARAEIDALLARFRDTVRQQVERWLAADGGDRLAGDDRLAGHRLGGDVGAASPAPEDADFLGATTTELRAMRQTVRPLARSLAARLAWRDRRRHGRVDIRRTIRHSLTTGGVPANLAFHRRTRTRPDLWLLCDVSGSVAEFARFMLAFVYAMQEEFPRIRTVVFVDDVQEITDILARAGHDLDPFAVMMRASAGLGRHRSDYGRALAQFWSRFGEEIGPWATVIISGDARTHDREPRADLLAAIARRARRVWFLNPEPRAEWERGDSVAAVYAPLCHHMAEVRNLRQLAACVAELA